MTVKRWTGSDWVTVNQVGAYDGSNFQDADVKRWTGSKWETIWPAIPDSAVYRWRYDAGSGSTAVDSIGSNDGTINGATWSSVSDAQGGYELNYDGTDDYVSYSTVPEVGVNESFSVGITVNPDSLSSEQIILAHVTGSDDRIEIGIANSEIVAWGYDGSAVDPQTLGNDSATSRMRLLITYDSLSPAVRIYKNTNDVGSSGSYVSTLSGSGVAFYTGDRTDSADRFYGGSMDDLIICDSVLSSSEIQTDYDAQPWT